MATITEQQLNDLRQLIGQYFDMRRANDYKYYYKLILNKEPPSCSCSYGMMRNELLQWLVNYQKTVNISK